MELIYEVYATSRTGLVKEASKEPVEDVVIESIKNRNTLRFYYEGDKHIAPGYRWVEPYAYGYSPRDGGGLLRAFQIREEPTKSGHKPMWRLFRTDKIRNISRSVRKFNTPRKGYNPHGDRSMAQVVVNAKF